MRDRPGSIAFVRGVAWSSAGIAVAGALTGALVTRGWRFPLALALGAVLDIGTIALILRRAPGGPEGLAGAGNTVAALIGVRLVLKAVLLGLAVALPWLLNFWGMVAGVLVFEATLMTVGSYSAASETMFGRRGEGGVGRGA